MSVIITTFMLLVAQLRELRCCKLTWRLMLVMNRMAAAQTEVARSGSAQSLRPLVALSPWTMATRHGC
eukprot:5804652-Amphidinium_carterae.4